MKQNIKIGITQGDINGISYEIIIKTLMDSRILELGTPIIYGSPKVLAYYRKALNINDFSLNKITTAAQSNSKRVNIVDCLGEEVKVEMGKSTKEAGDASYKALKQAVQELKDGLIDVLVTAPINKKNIFSDDFHFEGHTDYLKDEFKGEDVLMFLVSPKIKVGVVTGHVPLFQVPSLITKEAIISKLKMMNQSLKEDFGIQKPKIAVLGLNPHAGDEGLIGKEEIEQIIPAITEANDNKILTFGPFAADGLFGSYDFNKYDAVLAMYHDQGLAPFKTLAFDQGVNFTAGLSIVRTSPGHGTGYDIAGENKASEHSFRNALYMAVDIYKKRKEYKKLKKGAL